MNNVAIRYDYTDVPTIRRFANSDKFIRGLMGPFGSGKSSGCVVEIIRRALEQKPGKDGIRRTRWAVIRNTYPQLRDTTIKTFHDWFPPKYFGQWKDQEHNYIIKAFENVEIEIMFRALDRPEQVSNLLSLEVTGAWINEARDVPRAIFEALQGRVGRFPAVKDGGCTWSGIIMDTNPPDLDSWWFKLFEEMKPENCQIFKQPSGLAINAENLRNLPLDYYKNLALGKDTEYCKVYIHGKYGFVIDGRPIYPNYADDIHCKEIEALSSTMYVGWDFGLTPAAVFTQLAPTGQWLIVDELTADDMGIDRFSDQFLTHVSQNYPKHKFEHFADPAGGQRVQTDEKTCYQILGSKGIYVTPGEQDITMRVESVNKPLNSLHMGRPGLLLHPRCRQLRKGFQGGYQYRRLQTSQERYSEVPDKNQYSHPHDALQYVATRLFGNQLRMQREHPTAKDRYKKHRGSGSWMTA